MEKQHVARTSPSSSWLNASCLKLVMLETSVAQKVPRSTGHPSLFFTQLHENRAWVERILSLRGNFVSWMKPSMCFSQSPCVVSKAYFLS